MTAARLTAALLVAASAAQAQDCRPPKTSNEAKLLAFYSVPIVFSAQLLSTPDSPGRLALGADVAYVPTPDPALRVTSECFIPKDHRTQLSSFFPRPRVMAVLPFGFVAEASYLPPVRFASAKGHVFSAAVSRLGLSIPVGGEPVVLVSRLHGTVGAVQGAITCSRAALRPDDPADPCFGTRPSEDTFHPNMLGLEGVLGRRFHRGEIYLGGGTTWLRPRFRVGFRDGFGGLDDTRIVVDLRRASAFGGGSLRIATRWSVTGQVYTSFSDATTGRVGVAWEGAGKRAVRRSLLDAREP